jgi:hypothetical protein
MGKTRRALVAVASLAFTNGGFQVPQITINPDPPIHGQKATIHYTPNAKLKIEYAPGGVVYVTCDANGDAVVSVPTNANSMLVEDANNASVSAGFLVQ